jgi:hypothetical protein
MPRMAQKRFSVSVNVPNLMLSWQEAALLAIGLGAAAVLLAVAGHAASRARHAPRAGRWAGRTGPVRARSRDRGGALRTVAARGGNLSSGGYRGAIAHAWWVWHAEHTLRLPSELTVQRLLHRGRRPTVRDAVGARRVGGARGLGRDHAQHEPVAQALVIRRAVAHWSLPLPALRQRHYEPQDDQHAGQQRGDQARGNSAGDEIHDEQHRDQHGACYRG